MSNHDVDLLFVPFNDGEKTLPVLRVDNQIFGYDKAGMHVIPAKAFPHSDAWIKLGKAGLKAGSNVAVAAFSLYTVQFQSFNAVKANPVQFIRALISLFNDLKLPDDFLELAKQDWEDIEFDCMHILKRVAMLPLLLVEEVSTSSNQVEVVLKRKKKEAKQKLVF